MIRSATARSPARRSPSRRTAARLPPASRQGWGASALSKAPEQNRVGSGEDRPPAPRPAGSGRRPPHPGGRRPPPPRHPAGGGPPRRRGDQAQVVDDLDAGRLQGLGLRSPCRPRSSRSGSRAEASPRPSWGDCTEGPARESSHGGGSGLVPGADRRPVSGPAVAPDARLEGSRKGRVHATHLQPAVAEAITDHLDSHAESARLEHQHAEGAHQESPAKAIRPSASGPR